MYYLHAGKNNSVPAGSTKKPNLGKAHLIHSHYFGTWTEDSHRCDTKSLPIPAISFHPPSLVSLLPTQDKSKHFPIITDHVPVLWQDAKVFHLYRLVDRRRQQLRQFLAQCWRHLVAVNELNDVIKHDMSRQTYKSFTRNKQQQCIQ